MPATDPVKAASAAAEARVDSHALLQRIVLPVAGSPDTALYLDGRRAGRGNISSYASYFNAFPAAYWGQWTDVREVTLRLDVEGEGIVVVYRTSEDGVPFEVGRRPWSGEQRVALDVPLNGFERGGWIFFELIGDTSPPILIGGGWFAEPSRREGTATVAITTRDRPEYCTRVLAALGSSTDLLDSVDRVIVVDQGDSRVTSHHGFPEASEGLGTRLTIIEQANLGGSGGFSRGMAEALDAGESDYVILLDDDVRVDVESIRRLIVFANRLERDAIVGGHMLDIDAPTTLHAFAETISGRRFMWGAAVPGTDFGQQPLLESPHLHGLARHDYNGWWMCLIPLAVVRRIGLALPMFIKWDDAEYGLRARAAGIPTLTLPGAAVWHVAWSQKVDTLDWQAFYHARNRLVAALLHGPGGAVLCLENAALDVKHLLSFQYSTVALRFAAYRSVLAGPDAMAAELASRLLGLKRLSERFPDGRRLASENSGAVEEGPRRPARAAMVRLAFTALVKNVVKPVSRVHDEPRVRLRRESARWWAIAPFDDVLVVASDGSASFRYRRDRRLFVSGILVSARYAWRVCLGWGRLRREYRTAAGRLSSRESWDGRFVA